MENTDIDLQDLLTEACNQGLFVNEQTDVSNQFQSNKRYSYNAEYPPVRTYVNLYESSGEDSCTDVRDASPVKQDAQPMSIGTVCPRYHSDEFLNEILHSNVNTCADPTNTSHCSVQPTYLAHHHGDRETNAFPAVPFQSYSGEYNDGRTHSCGDSTNLHCSNLTSEYFNDGQRGAPYQPTLASSPLQYCISETKFWLESIEPKRACVFLCNRELWSKFHNLTTEMIISRQGRRMYPALEFRFTSLVPTKMYNVFVDIVPVDKNCWKYKNGKWKPFSDIERLFQVGGLYLHPDSPNNGAFWMHENVVFNKLKLTNTTNVNGQITLISMHKYQPRVHVIEVGESSPSKPGDLDSLQTKVFKETQFIAVTSYQNAEMTQLKIDNNPFASGFRDSKYGNVITSRNPANCQYKDACLHKDMIFPNVSQPNDNCGAGENMRDENECKLNECQIPSDGYSFSNPPYPCNYHDSNYQYSSTGVISTEYLHGGLPSPLSFGQPRSDEEEAHVASIDDVWNQQPLHHNCDRTLN